MSFTSITKDLFENTSITLKPEVHFVSSSSGVTGSAQVSALSMGKGPGSSGIKDIVKPPPIVTGKHLKMKIQNELQA